MLKGRRYRAASTAGVLLLTVAATVSVSIALGRTAHGWSPTVESMTVASLTTAATVGIALAPLSRPRPRRPMDVVEETIRRLGVATLILIVGGSLLAPPLLPPAEVLATAATLGLTLPAWFLVLRRGDEPERVLLVGDDPGKAAELADGLPVEPVGFASPRPGLLRGPTERPPDENGASRKRVVSDGFGDHADVIATREGSFRGPKRLGGLSRLRSICRDHDVDAVALAFRRSDRGEFFGVLTVAAEYDLDAFVHESHVEDVLVADGPASPAVETVVDPWPWYARASKRAFDLGFALVGGVAAVPLAAIIAAAIKLESSGPVLYTQPRTGEFGRRFRIPKFRTMTPQSEDPRPGSERQRITRTGRFLRRTHLDEIPQLWSVLVGDMSVVGPRAAWVEEERVLEEEVDGWRTRWHVKPGLTGLAQINDVTSTEGRRKLELDLEYVENRTLWLDTTIVVAQFRIVFEDVLELTIGHIRGWRT